MSLKTPSFWYRNKDEKIDIRESLLTPLASVYQASYALHQKSKEPYKSMLPVICIGNIVAGGTGKTPTALAIMDILRSAGIAKKPCFMIRGYGGAEIGPLLVDPEKHTAWETGDEALILAQYAPTIVGPDRAKGAQFAEKHGFDLILMDDGLQNPGLHKDLKLVVVNGEMGFGNGKMMPAGPLRQPLESGLKNADGFIFIGEDMRESMDLIPKDKKILHANLKPSETSKIDPAQDYIAFAGLGYAEKFFKFLRETVKLKIKESVTFGDHHPYDEDDIKALDKKAKALGARLITTKKDFIRVPKIEGVEIDVMPVNMVFEDQPALIDLIKKSIA